MTSYYLDLSPVLKILKHRVMWNWKCWYRIPFGCCCVQARKVVFLSSLALDKVDLAWMLFRAPCGSNVGGTVEAVQSESVLNNEPFLINRLLEVVLTQSRSSAMAVVQDVSPGGVTARAHFQLRGGGEPVLVRRDTVLLPQVWQHGVGAHIFRRCVLVEPGLCDCSTRAA